MSIFISIVCYFSFYLSNLGVDPYAELTFLIVKSELLNTDMCWDFTSVLCKHLDCGYLYTYEKFEGNNAWRRCIKYPNLLCRFFYI